MLSYLNTQCVWFCAIYRHVPLLHNFGKKNKHYFLEENIVIVYNIVLFPNIMGKKLTSIFLPPVKLKLCTNIMPSQASKAIFYLLHIFNICVACEVSRIELILLFYFCCPPLFSLNHFINSIPFDASFFCFFLFYTLIPYTSVLLGLPFLFFPYTFVSYNIFVSLSFGKWHIS